jgi:hypothetical protein
MLHEGSETGVAKDVGGEPLLSESPLPVGGSELEDAPARPQRQHAEQVPEVAERLDPMQLAAGEQRDEAGVEAAGLVGADEQPVLVPQGLAAQLRLAEVVYPFDETRG